MTSSVLIAITSVLTGIGKMYPASNFLIDFVKKLEGQQLSRIFIPNGPRVMLSVNGYRRLDMVFHFLTEFLDRNTEMSGRPLLMTIHTLC